MPSIDINELDYSRDWKLRVVESGGTGWSSDWDPDNPFSDDNTYQTKLEETTAILNNLAFDKFNIPFNKNNTIDEVIHNIDVMTKNPCTNSFKWTPYIATNEFALADFGMSISDITKFSIQSLNTKHSVSNLPTESNGHVFGPSGMFYIPGKAQPGHEYVITIRCYLPTFTQGGIQLGHPWQRGEYADWFIEGATSPDYGDFGYGIASYHTSFTVPEDWDSTEDTYIVSINLAYMRGYICGIWMNDLISHTTVSITPDNMSDKLVDSYGNKLSEEKFLPYYPKWFTEGVADVISVVMEKTKPAWVIVCLDPYGTVLSRNYSNLPIKTEQGQLVISLPSRNGITPRFMELTEYSVHMEFNNLPQFTGVVKVPRPTQPSAMSLTGSNSYYLRDCQLSTFNVDVDSGYSVVFENCTIHPTFKTGITSPIFRVGKTSTVKFVNCVFTVTTHNGTGKNFQCLWKDCFENLGRCVFENCEILTGERNSFALRTVEAVSAEDVTDVRVFGANYITIGNRVLQKSIFIVPDMGPDNTPTFILYGNVETSTPQKWFLGYVDNSDGLGSSRIPTLSITGCSSFPGCRVNVYRGSRAYLVASVEIPQTWGTVETSIPSSTFEQLNPNSKQYPIYVELCVPSGEELMFNRLSVTLADTAGGSPIVITDNVPVKPISIMDPEDKTIYRNTIIRSHVG